MAAMSLRVCGSCQKCERHVFLTFMHSRMHFHRATEPKTEPIRMKPSHILGPRTQLLKAALESMQHNIAYN